MASRLWLDDRRKPPWGYDLWAKTANEAIMLLEGQDIEHCSLDHDLVDEHYEDAVGPGYGEPPPPIDRSKYKELTGYAVIEWMVANDAWVQDISVHTLSQRGGEDMMALIKKRAPAHVKFRRVVPWEV